MAKGFVVVPRTTVIMGKIAEDPALQVTLEAICKVANTPVKRGLHCSSGKEWNFMRLSASQLAEIRAIIEGSNKSLSPLDRWKEETEDFRVSV